MATQLLNLAKVGPSRVVATLLGPEVELNGAGHRGSLRPKIAQASGITSPGFKGAGLGFGHGTDEDGSGGLGIDAEGWDAGLGLSSHRLRP